MRARSVVVVEPGGRLGRVVCAPPLTVRRVRSPDPACCALCLVGTAAGPLPGDDLALSLTVSPGAAATLVATGAQIAQGRGTGSARVRYEVEVGEQARLAATPGALVVTAGADVEVDVRIDLAPTATVSWSETVVLGRVGETAGAAVLRWDVRRAGVPLLRQDVDLADPVLRAWVGTHGGATVLTTALHVGPAHVARTEVHGRADVTQRLADGATLRTTLRARQAVSAPVSAPAATSSRVTPYAAVVGDGLPKRALTA